MSFCLLPVRRNHRPAWLVASCAWLALVCAPALRSAPDESDVALGKPARASSVGFWRLPPSHVTDGDPETGWRASSGDPLPIYVEVDLQAVVPIRRIELAESLRGGAYRTTGHEVHVSTDGGLWEEVGRGTTIGRELDMRFAERPARYVRLVITGTDGLDTPVISRIAVFGTPGAEDAAAAEPARAREGDTFRSFALLEPDAEGEIRRERWPERRRVPVADGRFRFVEEYERSILLVVPAAFDLARLTPVFTTTGGTVLVDGEGQRSGAEPRDFRRPVTYVVRSEDGMETPHVVSVRRNPSEALVVVRNEEIGRGLRYVGYSAMNVTEGDNLPQWYAYGNVNGVRYWLTPARQVGFANVTADGTVADGDAFEARKADLRRRILADPADTTWLNWTGIEANHRDMVERGTRHTSHHALSELRRLGIDIMAELNDSRWTAPFESPAEQWQRAWLLWQMFYAQSFYLALHFDVWKYQGTNEPELHLGRFSGSPAERAAAVERFVFMNAVYGDAVRSAVADVNALFGKDLRPIWGAPTLASNPTSDVAVATLRANRTDYRGRPVDFDIVDLFIMQRYSGSPATFLRSNQEARQTMQAELPTGGVLPIAYTEFNFMPGSVWRNQNFTGDAPHVFRAMSRVWAESMLDGVFAKYQFRIARPLDFGGNHTHHMFRTPRDPARNLLYGAPFTVSSEAPGHPLRHLLLNASSNRFAWRTADGVAGPHEAVWDLGEEREVRRFVMNLGTREEGLRTAVLQYRGEDGDEWRAFPGGAVRDGGVTQYGGTPRVMLGLDGRTPIDNAVTVLVDRVLAEPIRARHVRFLSEDPGPITVRRIYLAEQATEGDIGGPMKSAEVTRLFAEAFAGAPPLLRTEVSLPHEIGFAAYASRSAADGRLDLWVPQPDDRVDFRTTLDVADTPGGAGGLAVVRAVSPQDFGNVVHRGLLPASGRLTLEQPKTSVMLATVRTGRDWRMTRQEPTAAAQVGLGAASATRFGPVQEMLVRQHTAELDRNRVVYLKFEIPEAARRAEVVLLQIHGRWVGDGAETLPEDERFCLQLYGIGDTGWDGETITGATAPNLGVGDSLIHGPDAMPLAMLPFAAEAGPVVADVTRWVRNQPGGSVAFALVRQRRHENEINETDGVQIASNLAEEARRPHLEFWTRAED